MLAIVAPSLAGFQSCADLQSAFQSNECCTSNLETKVSEPLYSPVKDTITNAPTIFSMLAYMDDETTVSSRFLKELPNMKPVGWHTAQICEATDAAFSTEAVIADGQSGDTAYPFGKIKVLATVGEYDVSSGVMLVGVPDGMGAYLLDDETVCSPFERYLVRLSSEWCCSIPQVRYVFQSESYGPTSPAQADSWPYIVNNGSASFTGSHVMYIDYNRTALGEFMSHGHSAEHMVKGSGSVIENVYNLLGNPVGPRNTTGPSAHPHFSNSDKNGGGEWTGIMNTVPPARADWLMQSLCSAHLEERHQWGNGFGVEDDLFITNEASPYMP